MLKEVDWILPTELDTNKNANDHTKKLWEKHQENEYTRVNAYKEALCFGCLSNKASNATVSDICGDCAGKKGREALMAVVKVKHYGLVVTDVLQMLQRNTIRKAVCSELILFGFR